MNKKLNSGLALTLPNKKVNLCDNKPAMYENIDKSISFGLELEASFDEGELIKKVRKINKTWSHNFYFFNIKFFIIKIIYYFLCNFLRFSW